MTRKSLWFIRLQDTQGCGSDEFFVCARGAVTAAKRGMVVARKTPRGDWVGVPYVSDVVYKGEVVVKQ